MAQALFDGDTIVPERDDARLLSQLQRVYDLMADGHWRTLDEISAALRCPPASVSARLRDLRKERWGAHAVERNCVAKGLWRYRLITNPTRSTAGGVA